MQSATQAVFSRRQRALIAWFTPLFLESEGIGTLQHPLHGPDLAPCDFWFFTTLKKAFHGRRFKSEDEIKAAVHNFFQKIPKAEFEKTINEK